MPFYAVPLFIPSSVQARISDVMYLFLQGEQYLFLCSKKHNFFFLNKQPEQMNLIINIFIFTDFTDASP